MNSLIKFVKVPRRILRLSYSTLSSNQNVEPCDVLSSDEIDLEVLRKYFLVTT